MLRIGSCSIEGAFEKPKKRRRVTIAVAGRLFTMMAILARGSSSNPKSSSRYPKKTSTDSLGKMIKIGLMKCSRLWWIPNPWISSWFKSCSSQAKIETRSCGWSSTFSKTCGWKRRSAVRPHAITWPRHCQVSWWGCASSQGPSCTRTSFELASGCSWFQSCKWKIVGIGRWQQMTRSSWRMLKSTWSK